MANTPGLQPLDCILSYSHSNLQNHRLDNFLNHFIQHGKITQVFSASPLSMGLLAPKRPQWHPAPPDMIEASRVAATAAQEWPGGLTNLALGFAFRRPKSYAETSPSNDVPTLIGLSSLQEVHEAMAVWREVSIPGANTIRKSKEDMIKGIFTAAGWLNWSWSMPRNEDFDKLAVDQLGRKIRK
jgi:D-arabinose 1-dehydrogenase